MQQKIGETDGNNKGISRFRPYHIIESPLYLGGKEDNDYGNGFYVMEFEERAKSWAALNGNPQNAIVNEYELDLQGIQVLDLNDYGVLAWIAEVVSHRGTTQEAASILGNRMRNQLVYDKKGGYYEQRGI